MKRYSGIDYDFRPESYWGAEDPLALILRHVKGTNRRKMIRDYWDAGILKELDDQLLKNAPRRKRAPAAPVTCSKREDRCRRVPAAGR